MKNYGEELGWELGVDLPEWGNTEVYVKTISKGYLLPGEKPKDAYWRVCTTVAKRLGKPQMASKFFDYIWNGWLCLASPVLSNTGTDRGLPISCFGIDVGDSVYEIGSKNLELMLLAKHGFCVERAQRYRGTTYSFRQRTGAVGANNPIRASSQLESAMQQGNQRHNSSPLLSSLRSQNTGSFRV